MKGTILKHCFARILGFVFLFSAISVGAQDLGANFKNDWKKADELYEAFAFKPAVESYLRALESGYDSIAITQRIAECYRYLNDPENMEVWFKKVLELDKSEPLHGLYYAQALNANGKYAEAKKYYADYFEIVENDSRGVNGVEAMDHIARLSQDNNKYQISPVNINSKESDFAPAFYKDGIVFVSGRDKNPRVNSKHAWNNKRFLDLYYAEFTANDSLGAPVKLNGKVNSKFHEGPVAFDPSGSKMIFTRNNFYQGKADYGTDGTNKLKLFTADLKDDSWSNVQSMKFNNNEYSVGHPTLSKDGKTLFFASDISGGYGEADIYMSIKGDDGWGDPVNLGSAVNTEGNEMFPFFHESKNILYIASDGLGGLGGLDIFAIVGEDGQYDSKPSNVGYPLNSNRDDFALNLDVAGTSGFFSSNRENGTGDDDIYRFAAKQPLAFGKKIKGVVKDQDGNVLSESIVTLLDDSGNKLQSLGTAKDGSFIFNVDADKDFTLVGSKSKYFDGRTKASTLGDPNTFIADIELERDPGISLYALIRDKSTNEPLEGVSIGLVNNMTGEEELFATQETGDFRKALPKVKLNDRVSFNLKLEKEGYLAKVVTYNKLLDKEGQYAIHEDLNIAMDKLDAGADLAKIINLSPIYFDLSKWNIRSDAGDELDKVVKVMNENPEMEIELGSHTDCRGSAAFNEGLSDKRAKASAAYIKARITNPDRIYGRGFGESVLVNQCACEGAQKVTCTEEQHQANRRTEFKIVKY